MSRHLCLFCVAAFAACWSVPKTLWSQEPVQPDGEFAQFGIYAQSAPRAVTVEPVATQLPLQLKSGDRIALIGNTLFERNQEFGYFEALLHQQFPHLQLIVRHLAWSGDEVSLQPRPANFADTEQHLAHEKIDVIFAAVGFNESFAGTPGQAAFRAQLTDWLKSLRTKAFNGHGAPRIVLISPIANENVAGVAAADRNNDSIRQYASIMQTVAAEQNVGFVEVFTETEAAMVSPGSDLTVNGIHLNREGDQLFSEILFRGTFGMLPAPPGKALIDAVIDKNQQYFRRFRPLNTFYYTGGRNKDYGYLDFLPAMRNFDQMVENRDRRIHDVAAGQPVPAMVDDSNLLPLPPVDQSRGANEWMSAADELKAFRVDPRFEVTLFAGEEQFPDIANPIQMRWDSRGRLWVSCSTTYPHVYPGNQPNDKLVILEDTDGDGRADISKVFASDLHIPLSFEFGAGGVYVSEQPCLTFLQDTDGDDRADVHRVVLSGFGTEDSHHSLHDFTWTPDGDLVFRESVFHHSQVETPYGPVRQQNSGWFRFEPRTHRLISFGTYASTNPWGVTFDDWGQHVASHPVYAAAFHALDPPYPQQHPVPRGLQAYSGVCGHQFVDSPAFPEELQGGFIKVRYKPTNRVEIHRWKEGAFGYDEEYAGDLLFSTNLSFIPVDLQFGPRGDLYVCDWYNPVKGHMQYSLRDERRDRHSGRIWRITATGRPLSELPKIADASVPELLEHLKRPEYSVRYLAKRELRERDRVEVLKSLDAWVSQLSSADPRYRHHQLEALWVSRWAGLATMADSVDVADQESESTDDGLPRQTALRLLSELLACDNARARAAATQQLRYWHRYLADSGLRLNAAANDPNAIVRMEAAIAASYIGTPAALKAVLDVLQHPRSGHVEYAITCALGSRTLRRHWEKDPSSVIPRILKQAAREAVIKEPRPTRAEAEFDRQNDLKSVSVSCVAERMLFSLREFRVRPGQPIKVVFVNGDATDHNFVIVRPGALEDVGIAANLMAKDPRNASSDFIPPDKADLILQATSMIGPTRSKQIDVLRFIAPREPGLYPFVCTFPGHWIVMNGVMVVAASDSDAEAMLAASQPRMIRNWTMADFAELPASPRAKNEATLARGMVAFVKARCNQCHVVAGQGVNLGPDLTESVKTLKGAELLRQILEPSEKIHEKFRNHQFITAEGQVITGVVMRETDETVEVATNLLTPNSLTTLRKTSIEERVASSVSPMPTGLVNFLTREEILDLHAWLEHGDFQLPEHLRRQHLPGRE